MKKNIRKLLDHKGVIKYSANTAWLIGDKIIKLFLGFTVGVWVARYLGPEKFGIFNYVLALTGFLVPLTQLGFSGIVTREIVRGEEDVSMLISSAFYFRLLGSFFASLFLIFYLYNAKDGPIYIYLGLIFSLKVIFQSFEIIEFYYRAKVKSKYIFYSKFFGEILSSISKIILILLGSSLIWFAGAQVSLFIITAVFLVYFFIRENAFISLKYFDFQRGVALIKESWPLIFSGVFAILYLSVDKIMIEEMLNSYELGQYSVAVKISSLWYFIPMYIRTGILPSFVNAKKKDEELYYKRLKILFYIMALIAYIIIIPIYFFSNNLIVLLFGAQYINAGPVLSVHIISLVFFFMGIGRGLWIVNESYFKLDMAANIGAGILNIILNLIVIPKYGIVGAAYTTLISYSFSAFFSNLFFKPARKIFVMQIKSLLIVDALINFIKYLKKNSY